MIDTPGRRRAVSWSAFRRGAGGIGRFAVGGTGNAKPMTESSRETGKQAVSEQETAEKARRTAEKATAPAGRAAKKAVATSDDAVSAAKSGTERAAEATGAAARTAARGVESGRQALITASGQVAATAKTAAATARTAAAVVAQRKVLAAGVGAGLTALSAASYAWGRRAERQTHGPLTRWTQGRI